MKLEGKIFNFLGDSITEGVGTSSDDKRYFEIIKRDFGLASVNGYGISGTRFAKQTAPSLEPRFDKDFVAAPEVSKLVLNRDGTPKVFYHGSKADFTIFDKSKLDDRFGFYFTEDAREARDNKKCQLNRNNVKITKN